MNAQATLAPAPASSDPAKESLIRRTPHRGPWWSRLFELASAYLPLLLMGLLALGTWWLVKNTPVPEPAAPAGPARHVADYQMTNFMVRRFGLDGTMKIQIEGDTMRHYPDTDTLEVDNAHIRAVAPDGRITLASARTAVSNGDGSEVQLQGGAHVVRQSLNGDEPVEFRGEFLDAFMNTERVVSHLPVVIVHGRTEVHADAMEYDNLDRQLKLKGRVTATFAATGAGGHR